MVWHCNDLLNNSARKCRVRCDDISGTSNLDKAATGAGIGAVGGAEFGAAMSLEPSSIGLCVGFGVAIGFAIGTFLQHAVCRGRRLGRPAHDP